METVFTCFKNSPIVLLPAVVLFLLVIKKVDVIPTLFTSGIVALLVGIFYQGFSIQAAFSSAYSGFNTSMLNLPEGTELMPQFVSLVSRGGMFSMADFLISIPIMMAYCGVLQTIGVAQVISETLLKDIKKAGNAIAVNTFALCSCVQQPVVLWLPACLPPRCLQAFMKEAASAEEIWLLRSSSPVQWAYCFSPGVRLRYTHRVL